ncbi:hypothetical protein OU995_01330 [Roseateles sp. SL47]|jgi:hypothetical protein|uniref:hypothetical protein n=1 Tax=Roseateles sp. SL47 TaxID=2995138 RepID=UPI0022720503|nr:hypothetical protein [Roseateles sp. SL47]WAC73423.1 hypothetical protein OU995_01330 [Roseateles sp. SL47]
MNPTKSLVTGAVALTAFASVLGLAYAQVENTPDTTQTQSAQQPGSPMTDPSQQAVPAEQSMAQSQDPAASSANPQQQTYSESQSNQSLTSQQAQTQDNTWQNQNAASQQDPLPTEPTSAGTPAPRADRN